VVKNKALVVDEVWKMKNPLKLTIFCKYTTVMDAEMKQTVSSTCRYILWFCAVVEDAKGVRRDPTNTTGSATA